MCCVFSFTDIALFVTVVSICLSCVCVFCFGINNNNNRVGAQEIPQQSQVLSVPAAHSSQHLQDFRGLQGTERSRRVQHTHSHACASAVLATDLQDCQVRLCVSLPFLVCFSCVLCCVVCLRDVIMHRLFLLFCFFVTCFCCLRLCWFLLLCVFLLLGKDQ